MEGEEALQEAARGRGAGPGAGGGAGGAGGAGDGGPAGGGGGGGEPGAGRHGPPGEGLLGPRPAGAGQDEREAAEEDLLQEEQDGQWSPGPFLYSPATAVSFDLNACYCISVLVTVGWLMMSVGVSENPPEMTHCLLSAFILMSGIVQSNCCFSALGLF